jgi:hypothetical protein
MVPREQKKVKMIVVCHTYLHMHSFSFTGAIGKKKYDCDVNKLHFYTNILSPESCDFDASIHLPTHDCSNWKVIYDQMGKLKEAVLKLEGSISFDVVEYLGRYPCLHVILHDVERLVSASKIGNDLASLVENRAVCIFVRDVRYRHDSTNPEFSHLTDESFLTKVLPFDSYHCMIRDFVANTSPIPNVSSISVGYAYDYETQQWTSDFALWVFINDPFCRCFTPSYFSHLVSKCCDMPVHYFAIDDCNSALEETQASHLGFWSEDVSVSYVGTRILRKIPVGRNLATLGPRVLDLFPHLNQFGEDDYIISAHLFKTEPTYLSVTLPTPNKDECLLVGMDLQSDIAVITSCASNSRVLCGINPETGAKTVLPCSPIDITKISLNEVPYCYMSVGQNIRNNGEFPYAADDFVIAKRFPKGEFSGQGDSGSPCFLMRNENPEIFGVVRGSIEVNKRETYSRIILNEVIEGGLQRIKRPPGESRGDMTATVVSRDI